MVDDRSRALIDGLVAAYGPHIVGRLDELGIDAPDQMTDAIEEGRSALVDALEDLLERPYREQRRGPLEVFQEAMTHPTQVLVDAGVEPPLRRDDVIEAALPGDLYDLAPASSRLLGEEVWRLHLAWGVAKAKAMAEGESR